jgi:hypothetical protein
MAKHSHLDIEGINVLKMFWMAFTHRVTFFAAWRLIASAMTEFFIPQFTTKFRLANRHVVSVDHPLDESIPFTPEYVHIYLEFYPLWIRGAYFLYKEFGDQALPEIRDFLYDVADLYYEAGKIYRRCQSTTVRPKYLKHAKFRLLHAVDPHLHCVPSLHVLIVVFNHRTVARLIDKFSNGNRADYQPQKELVYKKAVEITESILFMKQHSVNCIPAALFFMSRLRPDYTEELALSFINDLFTDNDGAPESSDAIKDFIRSRYLEMMNTDTPDGGDHKDVIVDFLMSCPPVER